MKLRFTWHIQNFNIYTNNFSVLCSFLFDMITFLKKIQSLVLLKKCRFHLFYISYC
jgi:hypothetical protein